MIVICKRFYYFDDNDRKNFELFLRQNLMKKGEFAKKCNISNTLLTLLFDGKRSITKEIAETFTKNGFKVEIGE